jgi:iron complex outermembrane receptor protein
VKVKQSQGCLATRNQSVRIAKATLVLAVAGTFGMSAWAQDAQVFELGTVTVQGTGEQKGSKDEAIVTSKEMRELDLDTVSQAVKVIPGVNLTKNSRNEEMVSIRGFDSRQVPVYVDGIPLYVPYDGYVDFARFSTMDVSDIRVAKGAASLLYGPNAIGGAINLVTRKPSRPFEGDVQVGFSEGAGRKASVNLGGKQDMWYYQIGASYSSISSFRLPHGFTDHKVTKTDTGDYRRNADYTDKRVSFKVGLTPNATDEYAIGYVYQEGEKGNPVYTGQDPSGTIRRWRWPFWDKDSLYLIGNTKLGQDYALKFRAYYDRYKNGLDMYTNTNYTTKSADTSKYDDTSMGANLELISYALKNHELHLGLIYKEDRHEEDEGVVTKKFRDVTTSIALEDNIRLGDTWGMRVGVSYDNRDTKKANDMATSSSDAFNGLIELSHDLSKDAQAYASVARKTRFATIKNRYSYRMGRALPNPYLKPESALHWELGLRGTPWKDATGQAAVFYSKIKDAMQSQKVPGSSCNGGALCDQEQNVGEARHTGIELTLDQAITASWQAGFAYTYLNRKNLSDSSVTLTETPRHRLFAHTRVQLGDQWALQAIVESEKGRYVTFGTGYMELGGYAELGLKAIWKPLKDVTVDVGVRNLTDKNYELAEGYVMPGRTMYANMRYQF